MRYLRVTVFLSALLIATSVFLPYIQFGVGGFSLGDKTSLPLYDAVNNYSLLEQLADKSDATTAERIARGLLVNLREGPGRVGRTIRRAEAELESLRRAKEAARLDTIGTALRATSLVFLALLVVIAYLVLQSLSQTRVHRSRSYWTAGLMALIALVGVALFVVVREALAMGNEELGAVAMTFGSGAYMMLLSCTLGAGAAIAAVIVEGRELRRRES